MNGHYYLYVTTYYHQGWQILDVTDPKHIICKHLDDPRGKSGTVHPKIQIADGIMITASGQRVRFLPMEGVDYDDYDSGIEIWDVKTDPMNRNCLVTGTMAAVKALTEITPIGTTMTVAAMYTQPPPVRDF